MGIVRDLRIPQRTGKLSRSSLVGSLQRVCNAGGLSSCKHWRKRRVSTPFARRLRFFDARLTPPPPHATRPTFAIRPEIKPHTRRASMEIVIPYSPRALQAQLHAEMQAKRWGVVVCHRRFGKTVWAINHILRDALMSSKPNPRYAMMAPTYRQAKSVSWDFLNGFNIKLEKRVVSMLS